MTNGTREETIWLAGLLEGEGSFDAHRGKYPRVRLAMTDRDVVSRAAALMDTQVRLSLHPAPAQPTWHAEISGERAAAIMREILPFMGTRRSGKIATVLGTQHFRQAHVVALGTGSTPGPRITRDLGVSQDVAA